MIRIKLIKVTADQFLLFFSIFFVVVSFGILVKADKVEQGHRDSHHEKDFVQRTKRYAVGRVPLSYSLMQPRLIDLQDEDGDEDNYAMAKRYKTLNTNPAASHFRELTRQTRRDEPQFNRNLLGENEIGPLSDDDLQALLLLLEAYKLQGEPQVGKRETGKRASFRSKSQLEQPMSFENAVGDNSAVFLGQKRSKRIGDGSLKKPSSIRIKKETDPAVEANLDKIFSGVVQKPSISSHQVPQKKDIDWSKHFGIDKRGMDHQHAEDNQEQPKPAALSKPEKKSNTPPQDKSDKLKEKKEKSKQENETEEKADRKWILKEFYKNLAMATNVKRKRESPSVDDESDRLQKLERKMEEAGDQIIWDALKYTGAHKDAKLSPQELSQVKNEIIHKLSTAYSLEKIREAIEEFREELTQLKEKGHY